MRQPSFRIPLGLAAIILAAVSGYRWWQGRQPALPEGIAAGNGRLEADLVDIAPQNPGRLKEVLVREGDRVEPGQVLARMDQAELEASLARAEADLARAEADTGQAAAAVLQQASNLKLAQRDLARAIPLAEKGSLSQRTADQRQGAREAASAALRAAKAGQQAQMRMVQAARAEVARVRAQVSEGTLICPVAGRVLYRLAQPGEVLAAGGKALTVVDMSRIYMEVFLPGPQAASAAIGAEARILLDSDPGSSIPAKVAFVSPSAQFTPKYVETASERDKLMFRIKVEVPQSYVLDHFDQIKTGVRGMAYIRLKPGPPWPPALAGPAGRSGR